MSKEKLQRTLAAFPNPAEPESFADLPRDAKTETLLRYAGHSEPTEWLYLANGGKVLVDRCLYPRLIQQTWKLWAGGSKYPYAARNERYNGRNKPVYLHRYIVTELVQTLPGKMAYPLPKSIVVRFANGDSLDCRLSNLRILDPQDNYRTLAELNYCLPMR
jgi:hypothetical protein